MLRTNNNGVRQAIREHIEEYYPDFDDMKHDIKAAGGIKELIEGGCFKIYYYDIRQFLKGILQETDEEANRYDDMKVWKLYIALLTMEIQKMISKGGVK